MRVWLTNDTAAAGLATETIDESAPVRGFVVVRSYGSSRLRCASPDARMSRPRRWPKLEQLPRNSRMTDYRARVDTERTRRSLLTGETELADAVERLQENASVVACPW